MSYNLAKRGLKVLNIEKFGVNHTHGSSHGRTRIIRLAYYEDPRYVPLLRRAFETWKEIESKSSRKLLQITGGLMIGTEDDALVRGTLVSAKTHGIPHELLAASQVRERFEAFAPSEEFVAVHEPNAGILFAEDCVRAFVGLGSEAGCEYRFSEEVVGWKSVPGGLEVDTASGRQSAQKLVLCAGAWNPKLLGGLIPLQCERQVPLWFPSGGMERFTPVKMPIFMMQEAKGLFYYGVPDVGHGVKVARTHGGEVGDPDKVRREVTDMDVIPVRDFVRRRLAGLDDTPIASTTCLYTNAPDLNFVLGQLPEEKEVVVVSACSGHGFKFASVLGEVTADLATGKNPPYDISFMDPGRFQKDRK